MYADGDGVESVLTNLTSNSTASCRVGMLSALNESAIMALAGVTTLPFSMGVFQREPEKRSHPKRYFTKSEKLKTSM